MNLADFNFEWIDVPGRAEADVAETMARLEIRIGGRIVTRVIDKRGRSVRDGIITPLAPIAEWIAANWWALLEECKQTTRSIEEFESRHKLRRAERGFPLPDLEINTEGESSICEWNSRRTEFGTVDFLGHDSVRVPRADLRDTLWAFVEAVVARLNDRHVVETTLYDLWNSVRGTAPEEEPFCRLAGRLGLDPYGIDDVLATQLDEMDSKFPSNIRDEFAAAVPAGNLAGGISWIEAGLDKLRSMNGSTASRPRPVLSLPQVSLPDPTPWSDGYRLAQVFRETVGQPSDSGKFDFAQVVDEQGMVPCCENPAGLDAVVRSRSGGLLVYTRARRPETRQFLLARALFASCESHQLEETLLTTASTAWQQQSRAFAAELLVPSNYLRKTIRRDTVDSEDIGDLAAELGVSTWVVERQIENHGIARVGLSEIG